MAETDLLPEQTVPTMTHRKLLANTIVSTANWRKRKAEEFAVENPTAAQKSFQAFRALGLLAIFVESLSEDDEDLREIAIQMSVSRRSGMTYNLSSDNTRALSRYGMGREQPLTETDHRKFLRRLGAVENQERSSGLEGRAKRHLGEIQRQLRDLRRIQFAAEDELADRIEDELEGIMDDNPMLDREEDEVPLPPWKS